MRISFQNKALPIVRKAASSRHQTAKGTAARQTFTFGQWRLQYFSNIKELVASFVEAVVADDQAVDLQSLAKFLQKDPNIFRAFWMLQRPLRPSPLATIENYLKYYSGIDPRCSHVATRPNAEQVGDALMTAHQFLQSETAKGLAKPNLQTLLDIAGFDVGYHQAFSALVLLKTLKSLSTPQRATLFAALKIYSQPRKAEYPPAVSPLQVVSAFPEQRIYPASQNLMQVFYAKAEEKENQVALDLANALKSQGGNPFKLKFLGQVPPSFHVINFVKTFVKDHVPHMYRKPRLAKRKSLPSGEHFTAAFQTSYDWIKANISGRKPDLEIWFNMSCFELGFNDVMTAFALANYLAQLPDVDCAAFLKNLDQYPPTA